MASPVNIPERKNWSKSMHHFDLINPSAKLSPDRIHPISEVSLMSYSSLIAAMFIMINWSVRNVDVRIVKLKRLKLLVRKFHGGSCGGGFQILFPYIREVHGTRERIRFPSQYAPYDPVGIIWEVICQPGPGSIVRQNGNVSEVRHAILTDCKRGIHIQQDAREDRERGCK